MKLENKSIKQLKTTCWIFCSEYNRRKDTDEFGYGKCCTCNKRLHYKDGDAGHFMAGRVNSVLFYNKGIHLQCKKCNMNQGEQYLYAKFIENRYGAEEVKKQEFLRHQTKKISKQEYFDMIEWYKNEISKLK
ncbi:MAG: recombination protein NinG [Spirochaetota bacterium]|nr:recombination protein NinG [Spirochaetota bacterium]